MNLAKIEVNKAVRDGIIPKVSTFKCLDCGATAECYDHRDYLQPMKIDPVCRSCNKKRGPGLNRGF